MEKIITNEFMGTLVFVFFAMFPFFIFILGVLHNLHHCIFWLKRHCGYEVRWRYVFSTDIRKEEVTGEGAGTLETAYSILALYVFLGLCYLITICIM